MIETHEAEVRWRASALTRAIATCVGVALAVAVIGARWQLIAFAAPLLGVLCSISWQRPVPKILVHAEPDSQRCFEDEQARVTVWVTQADTGAAAVQLVVETVDGMQLEGLDTQSDRPQARKRLRWWRNGGAATRSGPVPK